MVADVARVKRIKELERTVVDRQAQNAHVVGVHHAMAKPDRLPGGHHVRRAFTDSLKQGRIRLSRIPTFRIEALDDVIRQRLELLMLVAITEMLKMAEADETRRHAGHHGRRFNFFTPHCCVRAGHAQCAGGGDSQPMHGFGAQEFTNRTAQHGPAIAHAGVRR